MVMLALGAASAAGFWFLGTEDPEPVRREAAPDARPPQTSGIAVPPPPRPAPADVERAENDAYDRCMALAMTNPEAAVAEAARWRQRGGADAALHCEAIARLRAGDGTGAAAQLEQLGRDGFAPREARASLLAQAGQIWLEAGDLDRAYGAATLALVLRPEEPDLLTDRAVIAASAGRFEEAIEDLTRVIDLRPFRAEAYVLRASAWRQAGQPALSRDDLVRALARDPENQEAWLESGFLRRDAADARGARADWERTVRIAPDTATAALAARNIVLLDVMPTVIPENALRLPGAEAQPPLPPPAPPRAPPRQQPR
ncbi:tetratricopeptide repeat protein [Elioraea sp.]|uniref:tetratricopeptide repeat protein n=1 Tax=Elioraea sp. TaxID=2185103 RepID=UPI0025C27D8C|nr:tetratricopeptide repeat protein [Elioraea sp.]